MRAADETPLRGSQMLHSSMSLPGTGRRSRSLHLCTRSGSRMTAFQPSSTTPATRPDCCCSDTAAGTAKTANGSSACPATMPALRPCSRLYRRRKPRRAFDHDVVRGFRRPPSRRSGSARARHPGPCSGTSDVTPTCQARCAAAMPRVVLAHRFCPTPVARIATRRLLLMR